MVSLFKDRSAVAAIWVLLLSFALHAHFFIMPPAVLAGNNDGLFSVLLKQYIKGLHPTVLLLLYHLLVITQALRLNDIFNTHRMFTRPHFLTAMMYVLLTSVFSEWNQLTPALIANSLVIWLFAKTVRLYNAPNAKTLLFNIGLVIGLSVLLYHPTCLLVIVALFAVLVVRPFNITELLVMFMGIAAPYYFLGAFLFLTDRFTNLSRFVPSIELNLPNVADPLMFFISLSLIVVTLLIGIYNWQTKSRRMLIQVRKNWGVLVVMLLVMLPLPFISKDAGLQTLLLWCIPVSPFVAYTFIETKRDTFANLIFWMFVAVIIINNWGLLALIKN